MKYYIIAGEASGDMYGAMLIKAIRNLDPEAQFRFWGGDHMADIAGDPVRHIRDLAIMGFVEVVKHLPTVLGNIQFCHQDMLQYQPDILVGIDYPGFNLKAEAWAHAHGIRTIHYISPNLWAWKKGRINGMRKSLDRLCYILPFEQEFFSRNHMPQATYVGHPLLDAIEHTHIQTIPSERPIIALLPGSRKQELHNSLPAMVALAKNHPEYHFIVAGMSLLGENIYRQHILAAHNISVVYNQTYSLLASAYAAVVCSGTATLETALFDVPQVVCYRANPISIAIARALVGNRIRYISLVNLIADDTVVTELLQQDFSLTRLEEEFARITTDTANRQRIQKQYGDIRHILGHGGASEATAKIITETARQ